MITLLAAATPPSFASLVDNGATVVYAAAGVAIVMTGVVVAVRAVRRFIGEDGYSQADFDEQYAELQERQAMTDESGDEDYINGHRSTWD